MVKDSAIFILSRKMSNPATLYWRGFTKPGKYVRGIDIYFALQTSLIPPLFIEGPIPSQESELSCICMLGVSIFIWAQQIILISPLFIEEPIPSHDNERSCICVLGVSTFRLSMVFWLRFWNCFYSVISFFCISVYYTVKLVCKGHWSEPEMCPLWAVSFYT